MKKSVHSRVGIFIFLLLVFVSSVSYSASLAEEIDQLISKATKPNEPGVAVLVLKNGDPILRKGYGMADMELSVPINPDMVFRLGSITKQFTAVSILMLIENGKLSLTDEITKYFPDYPVHGKKITIEHLLTHTSGIKSYTSIPEWLKLWRNDMSVQELIDLFKNQPMDFDPDQKWNYNNSGYILLGAIIEKVSGMTYEAFIQKNIFDPLEMTHSFYGSASRIIPNRIPGYSKTPNGYENAPYLSMTQPYSAGSLLSTVDDLAKWDAALYTQRLVKKSSLEKAWTPHQLANGTNTGYGFGWAIGEFEGHKVIAHSGGINGFITDGLRMPDDRIYIVMLSNNESIDPGRLTPRIAALCIGKPIQDPVVIQLPPDSLDQFVGVYEIDENDERYITKEGNQLFSQRKGGTKYELTPSSETEFFIREPETRFRFHKDAQGKVISVERLEYIQYGPREIGKKTDRPLPQGRQAIQLDPAIKEKYVGDYELAPGLMISIFKEGDSLMAQITGQEKIELFPETETRFFTKVVDATFDFVKDESGNFSSLVLTQGEQTLKANKK